MLIFFFNAKSYLLEVHHDELEKAPQWLNFHLLMRLVENEQGCLILVAQYLVIVSFWTESHFTVCIVSALVNFLCLLHTDLRFFSILFQ